MIRSGKKRFGILLLLAALSLLLVEAQLFKLQWIEHDFWQREAQKNRTSARTIPFKRGWILDRNRTPLALTQSIFELRFVFRSFRLHAAAGQISMVYYLLQDNRVSILGIYDNPEPFLAGLYQLRPNDITSIEDRWKRKDLVTYLKWLFTLTDEEGRFLFESDSLGDIPFAKIPLVQSRMNALTDRIFLEKTSVRTLEKLAGVEDDTFLSWPDTAVEKADRIVSRRLVQVEEALGDPPYLKVRKQHHEVDSYETTVHRNLGHEAAVRVTLAHDLYPGFYIVESTKRCYPEDQADLCPMLIGTCGLPSEKELVSLQEHRRRIETLSLQEELTEADLIEEESLRLKMNELDILPDEEVGRLGLEALLEPVLRGKRGFFLEERGSESGESKTLEYVAPIQGQDVMLTLDADLQRVCERALADTGYPGAVVLMNVHSGAVLAMATAPQPTRGSLTKDWGELLADKNHPLLHRAVNNQNLPPPGSVFKLVTSIAALEEGRCTIEDCFECTRRIQVGRSSLHCEGLHGSIAMEEAIIKSCNIYFYRLGNELGYDALFDWAERFGFGRRTGFLDRSFIGIEGQYNGFPEAGGTLKRNETGEANLMRLAIGQGAIDDVTPLQVARMTAGIATGRLPQPYLIARIGGKPVDEVPAVDLGIAPENLEFVRQAMKKVVFSSRGTASADPSIRLDLRPFKVAGKTGTPQVGGDRPSHACFAGYFPWDDPQVSFAVFVESCGKHGGEMAAPGLNRILESPEALPYVGDAGR
ncbi:MAG: hypothetical protein KJ645_07510 [Planctomycetes bacterium]|nr:hypothetical protein [Planctomycetota bacterium]